MKTLKENLHTSQESGHKILSVRKYSIAPFEIAKLTTYHSRCDQF